MPDANERTIDILNAQFSRDELSEMIDTLRSRGWSQIMRIIETQRTSRMNAIIGGNQTDKQDHMASGAAAMCNDIDTNIPVEIQACFDHIVAIEQDEKSSQLQENENIT